MKSKRDYPWDAGVDYDECKKRILLALEANKDDSKRVAKCLIYAIQLRNGMRISEATDALKAYYNGSKIPDVLVRKKKKYKTIKNLKTGKLDLVLDKKGNKIKLKPEYRETLWPEFINKPNFNDLAMKQVVDRVSKKQAQDDCRSLIGVNTHNFRYARITELSAKGVSDSSIAKITHHSDLKFILKYQQDKAAKKINREIK